MGMSMSERDLEYARNLGRVDFAPTEFDKLVDTKGARILWERSSLCSCITDDTGQPDFYCKDCYGKGFVYKIVGTIKGIVSSATGDKEQTSIGLLELGTTLVSVSSKDRVGFRDRLSFPDMRVPYSQVVKYTGDEKGEQLKYFCTEMISVRVVGLELDEDMYEVVGSRIKIKEGLLNIGDNFSVLMLIVPTYVVIDTPHELRGTYVKFNNKVDTWYELPKQHMIKREDLLPLRRGELLEENNY